jgi:hypothetical protein
LKPIQHDHCNVQIGPGESRLESCEPLPACRVGEDNCWYTYWEPSEEDRRRIAAGGHVRLCVVGMRHPPVMLDTEDWE